MNIVFIVPTGIGAEVGGHAGDANPAAKLFSSICDKLITHPNVVNASDINEMTENTLYVEGSILDRFLWGTINLREVLFNRILLAVNSPVRKETINAVNAARVTLGADIEIVELDIPLRMIGKIGSDGIAGGMVEGWKNLVNQVNKCDYDALAIASPIDVEKETKLHYFNSGGVNPWGGIEAITSKLIANEIDKPVAHAPLYITGDEEMDNLQEKIVTDPRIAPEMVSVCYIHCIFKGLHKAPRISYEEEVGIDVRSVGFLISPYGCFGEPHKACVKEDIPIVFVKENRTCLNEEILYEELPHGSIVVDNYWEAVGYVSCYNGGVSPLTVRRPIKGTYLHGGT